MVLLDTSFFSPYTNQKFENLKQHIRHPKLSLEVGSGQIHPLVPEKSESESFTQIWLTRCQTLYHIVKILLSLEKNYVKAICSCSMMRCVSEKVVFAKCCDCTQYVKFRNFHSLEVSRERNGSFNFTWKRVYKNMHARFRYLTIEAENVVHQLWLFDVKNCIYHLVTINVAQF